MTNPHGGFIWYELLTTDTDAAIAFYGAVVGWKARDAGMGEDMAYNLLSANGADIGGLMKLPADMPGASPGWLGYVGVDDVDAAADKAKAAGGSIHVPPTDIPGVGRFAMIADPQGAVFYVMRGTGEEPGNSFAQEVGHCAWNELVTSDQEAALAFYGAQFGWEKGDAMPMGEMGDYRFINHGGEMIGAVMNRPPDGPPPMWNFYFQVSDIDAAVATIGARGGAILYGPVEIPGGDFAVNAVDPQGAAFGLVGPRKS